MNILMKKLKAVFLAILLCLTSIIIIKNNIPTVIASGTSENSSYILSSDMIHSVTENLSNVIYTAYDDGELRKGRVFGLKGEHYTAD